ncbi:MAG: hypothetical protein IJ193_00380 [Bacilli bacterium]|nr:hypothetical protein [Bacilli bacterium]
MKRERISVRKLLDFIKEVAITYCSKDIFDEIYIYVKDSNGKETPIYLDNLLTVLEKRKSVETGEVENENKLVIDPYDKRYFQSILNNLGKNVSEYEDDLEDYEDEE